MRPCEVAFAGQGGTTFTGTAGPRRAGDPTLTEGR